MGVTSSSPSPFSHIVNRATSIVVNMVFQSRWPLSQSEYEAVKLRRDTKKTAEIKTAEPASDPEQPEVDPAGRRAERPIGSSSKKRFSVSTQTSQSAISTRKLATPAGRKVAKAPQQLNKSLRRFREARRAEEQESRKEIRVATKGRVAKEGQGRKISSKAAGREASQASLPRRKPRVS